MLTVICVGGYVLEYHGLRATQDVDAFYDESRKINEIIARVGRRFNLNTQEELWLNNNVASMNRQPPIDLCEPLYAFSNLAVLLAPIEYVLGMKDGQYLRAGFERYWCYYQIQTSPISI